MDRAFDGVAGALEDRERRFCHELAWGTTRFRGRLDHLLDAFVRDGIENTDPTVRELLRLGTYQILYMDRVPEYAAVSQTVDQVREKAGKGAAGFANAVLRKVGRAGDGPDRFPDPSAEPLDYLVAWGSHPRWLVSRWLERMPFEEVEALIRANNRRPESCLVPLEGSVTGAVDRLRGAGIESEAVGVGTDCVRLVWGASVEQALTVAHPAIVQDPAANLVVRFADVPSGTMVADLCAAPGGKALALSKKAARVFAADRSEPRTRMVRDNVERTGRDNVSLLVADASAPPIGEVDVVVVDAPCSGTGTLARHPDGRWRLAPEAAASMGLLQRSILAAAAGRVRKGGRLVYSTCTLEPEENERVVEDFLRDHPDFRLEPTDAVDPQWLDERGHLRVWPQRSGFDGAFAARMRRAP